MVIQNKFYFFVASWTLLCCSPEHKKNTEQRQKIADITIREDIPSSTVDQPIGTLEKKMINAGLININELDSTIVVDLKYSSTDNFLHTDVYEDLDKCFLQRDVAEKLVLAQMLLKSQYPYYSLIVYDGARQRSVQKKMWDILKLPVREKTKYLSNPNSGSLHNFGAAVDLSIVDEKNKELDMGTKFDYFGELAYPEKEEQLNIHGELSFNQISNRKLLRSVMEQAGFFNIETEWWHFNSCSRAVAMKKYKIIE